LNSASKSKFLSVFLSVSCSANADPIPGQGTWETTLLGRDMDGHALPASDGGTVFLYDTSLNITWLRNGSQNGLMTWSAAMDWASGLQVGAFAEWRLPNTPIPDASCTLANSYPGVYSQGYGVGCSGSEMGHLFNVTLQNATGAISNSGNFQGLQNYYYWSKTPLANDPYYVWGYHLGINGQAYTGTGNNLIFSMAVRDGDVLAPVPEPASAIWIAVGLFSLAIWRRTKQIS
jgi:hypothetical protein